ncbi:MAG: flagellar protein [Eubacteriales bacterium]
MKSGIDYHKPEKCAVCGGIMRFKGVGEYECDMCGHVALDDYGRVRCYIEEHPGANATQIEAGTGVSQKHIRQLLREARIEIASNSSSFLKCEICGAPIRSGMRCENCERR